MKQRRSLATIQTLADSAERESARTVAQRRDALAAEEQRLRQLQEYLREYGQMSLSASGHVATLRMRRRFVERIRIGISEQERLIAGLREQLERDLGVWRKARSHALALEKYAARLSEQAHARRARREQASTDEVGQKMYSGA